jgi:biopolymer transport protein ExbB/TolQ
MINYFKKQNLTTYLILSFFASVLVIQVFYLAVINPISFELMSMATLNNESPPRHFSVVLKDPEQKICLILFLWSMFIGLFNFYILNKEYDDLKNSKNLEKIFSEDFFKVLIENKLDGFQLDLTFIKYISWAIPSIGFIGTVRGIGEALSKAAEAIDGNITGMTASLGVAFNSTFVALLLSIFLMMFIVRLEHKQDNFIISLRSRFLSS